MAELPKDAASARSNSLEKTPESAVSADLPGATSGSGSGSIESSEHTEKAASNVGQDVQTQPQVSGEPTVTSDPLQVAAQLYPWMYMTSTLESCFQNAEKNAHADLKERAEALEAEEVDIKDQRVRFEAERLIEFYDELSSDKFAKEAPITMQAFLSHGDACTQLEAEALEVASQDLDKVPLDSAMHPTQAYNDLLEKLENLKTQAFELESSIQHLVASGDSRSDSEHPTPSSANSAQSSSPTPNDTEKDESAAARSQIAPIFSACLPIVRARVANISMAQQLVEGAKENFAMMLHLESLGIGDEEAYEDGVVDDEVYGYDGAEDEDDIYAGSDVGHDDEDPDRDGHEEKISGKK